jgi:hypothetical protein
MHLLARNGTRFRTNGQRSAPSCNAKFKQRHRKVRRSEPGRTEEALRQLNAAIDAGRAEGINLEDFSDADLEMQPRPDPALTLADLRAILDRPAMLPRGTHASALDKQDYRYQNGELPKEIRVTTDREFFEMHSDSVEFWTPGSPTFPDLSAYRS